MRLAGFVLFCNRFLWYFEKMPAETAKPALLRVSLKKYGSVWRELRLRQLADQTIMPAPTVLLLLSSMTMKAPVARFSL